MTLEQISDWDLAANLTFNLTHSEPIVIKPFHLKEGASEGAQQLLNQLVAFALVINIFLLPPVLFTEYTLNPLSLERRL
jgi:hypothetical protein